MIETPPLQFRIIETAELTDPDWQLIGECEIAGVPFTGNQHIVENLNLGEELFLAREPDNSYDPNAIRVETVNTVERATAKLGYIPGKSGGDFNKTVAAIMAGEIVVCAIVRRKQLDAKHVRSKVVLGVYMRTAS